jgi:transposase
MNDAEVDLPNDVALCHELICQQADSLDKVQRRIEQLEHAMDVLLRQKYGPRSERLDPNHLRLFTEENDEAATSQEADIVLESPEKPKRTWKRRGRQTLPEHLPRVPVVIELSDHDRACPGCGGLRAHFDDEISEQLDYVPASLFIRQFIRRKYACRSCQEHVAIPPKIPQPIDKGLAGPGLLAHVITNKFASSATLPPGTDPGALRREDLAEHALQLAGPIRRVVRAALQPDDQASPGLADHLDR